MGSSWRDGPAILAAQRAHQVRLAQRRMTWWIPALFVIGLAVSILGLVPSIVLLWAGQGWARAIVFAVFTVFFGWVVAAWVVAPFRLRPRIVPYFTRPLDEHDTATRAAFARGRGLYREIAVLDALAGRAAVTPLSAFGFAYDHYEQAVAWHPAGEGLRTVEALRAALHAQPIDAPDVADDLDTLASVLRVAADRDVAFSLVLRLHARDSLQAVMTRENRSGSFW